MEAAAWAVEEAAGAQLGDRRRNGAFAKILTALVSGAGRSFSAALGEATRQSASLVLHREGLTPNALLAGHYQATARRCCAERFVLVSQDSTTFNYTRQRATSGLGRLADKSNSRGPWARSALALSLDGRALGWLALAFWSRCEQRTKAQRRERPHEQEESFKREATLRDVAQALPLDCQAVIVSDRESDVFEYLRAPVREGLDKLVRAAWARRCQGEEGQVMAALAPAGGALAALLAGGAARRSRAVRCRRGRGGRAAGRQAAVLDVADHLAGGGRQRGTDRAGLVSPTLACGAGAPRAEAGRPPGGAATVGHGAGAATGVGDLLGSGVASHEPGIGSA